MTDGRKLRSKDELKKNTDKALFNFENINKLVHRDQTIKIVNKTSHNSLYRYYEETETTIPTNIIKSRNIEIRSNLSHRKSKQKVDILDDSIYETFHKKMKKEERTMVNIDRSRILSEVDNLDLLLQSLNQYDWIRHLPNITQINDIRDYDELETKKELTIKEIQRILNKFENWKRRQDKLVNDIKKHDTIHEDSDHEQEFHLPIEYLKQKRLKERRIQEGPIIKLNLRNGYALVIEPFTNPRIVKIEDRSKHQHTDEKFKGSVSANSPSKLNNNLKPTSRRPNIDAPTRLNKLNFKFDEHSSIAFGAALPNIKQAQSFSLNSSWRLHAQEWKHAREKLRRKLRKLND